MLKECAVPLAVVVTPFARLPPHEAAVDVAQLDGGEPLTCAACLGFANSHTRFLDRGDRFICTFCNTIGAGAEAAWTPISA
jgi:protein transport protein SEC24